jgi:hypothetical protein
MAVLWPYEYTASVVASPHAHDAGIAGRRAPLCLTVAAGLALCQAHVALRPRTETGSVGVPVTSQAPWCKEDVGGAWAVTRKGPSCSPGVGEKQTTLYYCSSNNNAQQRHNPPQEKPVLSSEGRITQNARHLGAFLEAS